MSDNASRTVRTHMLSSWNHISNASKILLLISLMMMMIQFTVSVVILVVGREERCERPLELYLIVYTVRVALSCPLLVYQHLFRNTTEEQAVNSWADRMKSLLDLFGILWFIIGNYIIFSTSSCSITAPMTYYTLLAWIVLGYLMLIVPLLLCLSVVFCLPLVLVALRAFNINISNVMVGGTKEEIEMIPIYRYRSLHHTSLPSEHIHQKKTLFSRLLHKNKSSQEYAYTDISIDKAEDALCSICLSDYENEELLCKLSCDHIYHMDCIHEWLALNTKCPLCKRDFRPKHQNEEEE